MGMGGRVKRLTRKLICKCSNELINAIMRYGIISFHIVIAIFSLDLGYFWRLMIAEFSLF